MWYWYLLTFMIGGNLGMIVAALMFAIKGDDEDEQFWKESENPDEKG